MKNNRIFFSLLFALLFSWESGVELIAQERKISKAERQADRNFVRQRFDKAMAQYEDVLAREKDETARALIQLKHARLYFMLRDYKQSSAYYERVMAFDEDLLSVEDICEYVDALRFTGENRKAESVCLNHAYKDIYSRYQRFQNSFEALSMRHGLHGDPGFLVEKLPLNTENAEFWVGSYDNQPFYAKSQSEFNDPLKIFFHRTHFYALRESEEANLTSQKTPRNSEYFNHIPVDMQNGPLTFSPDLRSMVTTVIHYDKSKASIRVALRDASLFQTRLLFSTLKSNQKRFTKYTPLFPQMEGYSYAHPCFFNGGASLLFSSNMPGGYGGFDLYVIDFDADTQKWGRPVNLGSLVNTEGDEVFPVVYGERLIFASNGLPGFGGYDLFSVSLEENGIIPGTLYHFPHPVNSVFNDYCMLPLHEDAAYFVSDRDLATRDDVYYLRRPESVVSTQSDPLFGMSEVKAVTAGQFLLRGAREGNSPTVVDITYEPKGFLFTLYFDFNSDALTPESVEILNHFVEEMGGYRFNALSFHGYADEIGGELYNVMLSERRANRVANHLRDRHVHLRFDVIGHGRLKLTPQELGEALLSLPEREGEHIDWIRVNRRARRVDVFNN